MPDATVKSRTSGPLSVYLDIRDLCLADPTKKLLLFYFATRSSPKKGWTCYPPVVRIATDTGLSPATIKRVCLGLKEDGLLEWITGRRGKANTYTLNVRRLRELVEQQSQVDELEVDEFDSIPDEQGVAQVELPSSSSSTEVIHKSNAEVIQKVMQQVVHDVTQTSFTSNAARASVFISQSGSAEGAFEAGAHSAEAFQHPPAELAAVSPPPSPAVSPLPKMSSLEWAAYLAPLRTACDKAPVGSDERRAARATFVAAHQERQRQLSGGAA